MAKEEIIKIIRDSHRVTEKLGIPHWFLGGIAIAAHVHGKLVREHEDVDMIIQTTPDGNEIELLKNELAKKGYKIDPKPPHPLLSVVRAWLGKTHFLDFAIGYPSPKGGLDLPLHGGTFLLPAEALNSEGVKLAGVGKIPVLSAEALFILKDRGWLMRPKDKADLKGLQQIIDVKKTEELKSKSFGAHLGWKTLIRHKWGEIVTKLFQLNPRPLVK